ncbi:unnamed protein product [Didymodactylos carnosus]|uniref:Uncharacterized protein n=1 Tax=Didymodactylos carnosus TaxID=1234261 RepID=A0A815UY45_9BILA|nr:unnamed protein product [Didymodactylos carnosus]CAF1525125.1 unnamed protein product [Didymodactylos carnosus]CAF4025528.1 unnamed protein product [Didymodactylos carnosus]CAF4384029.1 unnamed protein product [Didymodactylos carnosus]
MGSYCTRISSDSVLPNSPVLNNIVPKTLIPDNFVDDEFLEEINKVILENIGKMSVSYKTELDRIVNEMENAAPDGYLDLMYSDYPEKNGKDVRELAMKNISSDDIKSQLEDKVHDTIDPKVEEKIADLNPIAQEGVKRTVDHSVKQMVSKAVDNAREQLEQQAATESTDALKK